MVRAFGRFIFVMLAVISVAAQAEVVSLATQVSSNRDGLTKLSVGMSKNDVVKIMGTSNADTKDGLSPNPWTIETFTGKDGAKYEVLFYVTRKNPPFTPIGKFLTTPVILKNGKVSGWGDEALEKVRPSK